MRNLTMIRLNGKRKKTRENKKKIEETKQYLFNVDKNAISKRKNGMAKVCGNK